jgi:glycerol-3-phosphate dehydrogenase
VIKVTSRPECWHIQAQGPHGIIGVKAKAFVNTTGPWLNNMITDCQLQQSKTQLKLVQGSHIVVPKLYEAHEAVAYQNHDGRLIFFVPYLDRFTLVGTTEVVLNSMTQKPYITESECNYLLCIVNNVFGKNFNKESIIHHYAGVRALVDDKSCASKTSRDYKIETIICPDHKHPRVDILGGKITTWRLVSEEIVNTLIPYFPFMKPAWTKKKILPGARYKTTSATIFHELTKHYGSLPSSLLSRYAKTYGLRAFDLIGDRRDLAQFGAVLAPTLYEREVEFLMNHEWAKTPEDILYRRTKLGLALSTQERSFFSAWFGEPQYAID